MRREGPQTNKEDLGAEYDRDMDGPKDPPIRPPDMAASEGMVGIIAKAVARAAVAANAFLFLDAF